MLALLSMLLFFDYITVLIKLVLFFMLFVLFYYFSSKIYSYYIQSEIDLEIITEKLLSDIANLENIIINKQLELDQLKHQLYNNMNLSTAQKKIEIELSECLEKYYQSLNNVYNTTKLSNELINEIESKFKIILSRRIIHND